MFLSAFKVSYQLLLIVGAVFNHQFRSLLMKIDRIELFHISIPFAKPYKLSKVYGTRYDAEAVVIKVHTDEGIVGLGEAEI